MGEWALTGGAQHEERCGGPFMAPSRPCGKCFPLLPDTFRGSSMGSFVSRWVVVEKHEQIAHILRTRGTLFDVSLRCLVWHGGRRRPTKATPHPPTHVCRGRGLAVPEVLLIKNFNVGAQIWYHKEPEESGERGLLHCDSSNNHAVLPFNTLLHEFSIDQIHSKVGRGAWLVRGWRIRWISSSWCSYPAVYIPAPQAKMAVKENQWCTWLQD